MSRWHKFVLICNLLVIASTLIASWAPSVSPSTFSGLAYFGLAFPYLIFLNLFFFVFWLTQKKWMLLLPILTFIFTQTAFKESVAFSFGGSDNDKEIKLKVMSYNVRNFDLYNWKSNTRSRDEILNIIKEDNPDVICFQEFFTAGIPNFDNVLKVQELGYRYVHTAATRVVDTQQFGLATFSKYPFSSKDNIRFENSKSNMVLQSDINVDGNLVRVYNAHLQSIHLSNNDYALFDQETEKTVGSALSVFKKLRRGFRNRASQAEILATEIQSTETPKILCGDFNDVPVSYTYKTLSEGMNDAYLESGFGFGGTYSGSLPIVLRIDYMFVDPSIGVEDFNVLHEGNSDHYPISAVLSF